MNGIREAAGDVAPWYDTITLDEVLEKFEAIGAHAVWAKYLVRNNNSKNQIYVAPNVNKLAFLPMGHPVYTPGKSQKPGLNKWLCHNKWLIFDEK